MTNQVESAKISPLCPNGEAGRGIGAEITGRDLMGNRCAKKLGVPRPATEQQ